MYKKRFKQKKQMSQMYCISNKFQSSDNGHLVYFKNPVKLLVNIKRRLISDERKQNAPSDSLSTFVSHFFSHFSSTDTQINSRNTCDTCGCQTSDSSVSKYVSSKHECTMDLERVCATVVTDGCYNSCVHLRSASRCMLIFQAAQVKLKVTISF